MLEEKELKDLYINAKKQDKKPVIGTNTDLNQNQGTKKTDTEFKYWSFIQPKRK